MDSSQPIGSMRTVTFTPHVARRFPDRGAGKSPDEEGGEESPEEGDIERSSVSNTASQTVAVSPNRLPEESGHNIDVRG